ncbi:hypothetical protein Rsub_01575 [Raphidocelis subcapitata]|uniref:Protein kinase domain-containing protein n=1 Tax=Raphidocelis subcapitata TaxID=307507 RepID=A0A2V0NMF4_9CHLO|nr:hypothetical protein Rsub_01575 [Raphidocelis subcapitata]|eukprot:GBF88676.1 hypothetical protein Rsub_01575 [Raphidocelis subcapitata]
MHGRALGCARSWAAAALGTWGRSRLRGRTRAYLSTAAEPASAEEPAPKSTPAPTIFSSRAKIAPTCPEWLKRSKSRTNLEKSFNLEEVYDAEYSSVQIATPKAAPAQAGVGAAGPHKVVIKTFKKPKLLMRPDLQQKLKQEWDIHTALLDHPNVIKPYLATEDDAAVGLFMEYAGESDAYSYLSAKQRLSLREDDARQLMHDVLSALLYMHEQGIVHRDIKSENVFRTDCGTWKLGDFGSALRLGDGRSLERQVLKLEGTFSFAAPEYVRIWKGFQRAQLIEATTFKLDSWSAGALAYDVLCGRAPFALREGISREDETEAVLRTDPEFPSGLSYNAVSFMMQALEKCPQKRPSVRQLLAHPWFEKPREQPAPAAAKRRSRSSSSGATTSSSGGGGGGTR